MYISQPSVIGSSQERGLALLSEHYNAVAYRGLIRGSMLRKVPLISGNPFNNFAADTVWMARLARVGDLVRVPRLLYRPSNDHAASHPSVRYCLRIQAVQGWYEIRHGRQTLLCNRGGERGGGLQRPRGVRASDNPNIHAGYQER